MNTTKETPIKELKIESGIAMPPSKTGQGGYLVTAAMAMNIGDSVLVGSKGQASNLSMTLKRMQRKGAVRMLPDGSIRVWRVK